MLMTTEDIQAQKQRKAEQVQYREELECMYDSGKSSAGKEFECFIKIKHNKDKAGTPFLKNEYEKLIQQSFFNEVFLQIRNNKELDIENEEYFDSKLSEVRQKSLIIEMDEIFQIILSLSECIDLKMEEQLLQEKFESYFDERNTVYEQRFEKLLEVMNEIDRLEKSIKQSQNVVENILKPQNSAIIQT